MDEAGSVVVIDFLEGRVSRTATFEQVSGDMPFILSGLKSLLETGRPLVPAEAAVGSA